MKMTKSYKTGISRLNKSLLFSQSSLKTLILHYFIRQKINQISDTENYRSMSILDSVSIIYEKYMHKICTLILINFYQIMRFLFRKGSSQHCQLVIFEICKEGL